MYTRRAKSCPSQAIGGTLPKLDRRSRPAVGLSVSSFQPPCLWVIRPSGSTKKRGGKGGEEGGGEGGGGGGEGGGEEGEGGGRRGGGRRGGRGGGERGGGRGRGGGGGRERGSLLIGPDGRRPPGVLSSAPRGLLHVWTHLSYPRRPGSVLGYPGLRRRPGQLHPRSGTVSWYRTRDWQSVRRCLSSEWSNTTSGQRARRSGSESAITDGRTGSSWVVSTKTHNSDVVIAHREGGRWVHDTFHEGEWHIAVSECRAGSPPRGVCLPVEAADRSAVARRLGAGGSDNRGSGRASQRMGRAGSRPAWAGGDPAGQRLNVVVVDLLLLAPDVGPVDDVSFTVGRSQGRRCGRCAGGCALGVPR